MKGGQELGFSAEFSQPTFCGLDLPLLIYLAFGAFGGKFVTRPTPVALYTIFRLT